MKSFLKEILPHFISKRFNHPPAPAQRDFRNDRRLVLGNSVLRPQFSIRSSAGANDKACVHVGDDCVLDCQLILEAAGGKVNIGNRVFIGNSTVISINEVKFGDDIFVSWGCTFADHDGHSIDYRERANDIAQLLSDFRNTGPLTEHKNWSTVKSKAITVSNHAWIGMNCIILKGVTIGEGAVVAAGSVVTRDVAPWTIVGGNPATFIREIPAGMRKS